MIHMLLCMYVVLYVYIFIHIILCPIWKMLEAYQHLGFWCLERKLPGVQQLSRQLDLPRNCVGGQGVKHLLDALEGNYTLLMLDRPMI